MIESCLDIIVFEQLSYLLCTLSTAHIYNGTALHRLQDVDEFRLFVWRNSNDITEVFALKAHAKDILRPEV